MLTIFSALPDVPQGIFLEAAKNREISRADEDTIAREG